MAVYLNCIHVYSDHKKLPTANSRTNISDGSTSKKFRYSLTMKKKTAFSVRNIADTIQSLCPYVMLKI